MPPEPDPVAGESGKGPLSDLRVLDLSRLLPGGFCTLMLADLGADVIKVEDTGAGDYVRWAPPYYGEEDLQRLGTRSAYFLALNRSKRSIRLDLKSDAGREALLRLVGDADVLVESFRPGVMDRLGIGYEELHQANPRLVYCPITGYGQSGPNRDRAGHDMNYLGLNGVLGLNGEVDGPPVQPAVQIADLGGGAMAAAFAILAAVHESRNSGEGQMVDVSMTDGAASWLVMVAAKYFAEGIVPERGRLELAGAFVCYMPYRASDGWVTCGALEPKFWAAWCGGVDRADLIEKQFEAPGSDAWREISEVFSSRTRDEWREFNDQHDCCIEPVLDLGEALDSQQAMEREMVVDLDQPQLGKVRQLAFPVPFSRTPARPPAAAPALGEHTAEVLKEAGFREDEIEQLISSGSAAGLNDPDAEQSGSFLA
jgi:crotonobetainyl-CoA:carnitine CoA-transferase CaiB-like acyl-CoA transferase